MHTLIDRPAATFELIAFATRPGEGRVDNVLLSIKSKSKSESHSKSKNIAVVPKIHIRTCERLELESYTVPTASGTRAGYCESLLLVAAQLNHNTGSWMLSEEEGFTLYLPHGEAAEDAPGTFRPATAGRPMAVIPERTLQADALLHDPRVLEDLEALGTTNWSLPGRHGEFLTACARNIR